MGRAAESTEGLEVEGSLASALSQQEREESGPIGAGAAFYVVAIWAALILGVMFWCIGRAGL